MISLYAVANALPKVNGYIRFDQIFNSSHTVEYNGQGQKMLAGVSYALRKGLLITAGTWFSFWHNEDVNNPVSNGCASDSYEGYCNTISYSHVTDGEKGVFVRAKIFY